MVSWIIIAVLLIAAVMAIKLNHLRHRVWIILVIVVALFIYISTAIVYKENQLKVESTQDFFDAARIYLGWLGNGFQNLKSLTGNAVNMDWKSTNGTLINDTKIPGGKVKET